MSPAADMKYYDGSSSRLKAFVIMYRDPLLNAYDVSGVSTVTIPLLLMEATLAKESAQS